MKYFKKFASVALALVMVLALTAPAFAATNTPVSSGKNGDGQITITNAHQGQTYGVWRIFEAVVNEKDPSLVVYKPLTGKSIPDNDFFKVNDEGMIEVQDAAKDSTDTTKLSAAAVAWLTEKYQAIGEFVVNATPTADGDQVIQGLQLGYYYVTTTTGTAVSVDTTNKEAVVQDKNTGSDIDKTITAVEDGSIVNPGQLDEDGKKALAQVGTVVDYEVRIFIAPNAKSYVFTDVMTKGLTYQTDSMKVYLVEKGAPVAEGAEKIPEATYGTLTVYSDAGDTDPDIKIEFEDKWLAANNGKDIILQYKAKVNTNALISGDNGNPNTATIQWGNKDGTLKGESSAEVFTAKITVVKVDGDGEPLAGAGFILQDKTSKKYYTYDKTDGVVWVDNEDEAEVVTVSAVDVEITEDDGTTKTEKQMQAIFSGLANGTYTLIEKVVPAGYNKADPVEITIDASDVSVANTAQSQTVVNQGGAVLPSTGGIGTTIFYIVGGVLVVGAVVLLITKRRTSVDDE